MGSATGSRETVCTHCPPCQKHVRHRAHYACVSGGRVNFSYLLTSAAALKWVILVTGGASKSGASARAAVARGEGGPARRLDWVRPAKDVLTVAGESQTITL